jgi:hypothetical protein
MTVSIDDITARLQSGSVIPYLGPGMLSLCGGRKPPVEPVALAEILTAKVSVPHKIRKRVTQAAQFIENFKHRKTLTSLMDEAYAVSPEPSTLHRALAASGAELFVDCWYDDTFARAMSEARPGGDWFQVQGLSQSEHFGTWFGAYDGHGQRLDIVPQAGTMLYKPWGSHSPASNYLISDSDFVEVLTEIDIQTPIPPLIQSRRSGRSFLFLGCRFDDQLTRAYARQIMKRSSSLHWAVLPDAPTRMEAKFLAEQNIVRIDTSLAQFADGLTGALASVPQAA